jgi:hypothetical protein
LRGIDRISIDDTKAPGGEVEEPGRVERRAVEGGGDAPLQREAEPRLHGQARDAIEGHPYRERRSGGVHQRYP